MLILFVILGITLTINISDVSAASNNQTTTLNQVNPSLQQTTSSDGQNAGCNSSNSGISSVNNEQGAKPVTPKVTFTTSQINSASSKVKAFFETNQRLPKYITISNYKVTMPQFLELLTTDLMLVKSGSNSPIVLKMVNNPTNPQENVNSGNLMKSEYLTLAKKIKMYIDSSGKTPNYITSSLGKIRYENLIYTYSKVMNFYKINKRLPNMVSVNAFTTFTNTSSEGSAANNATVKTINTGTPPKNGYSAYNIKITPQTVTATAKCSCGKGTYTYKTRSFVNYCPQCHHYGTLTYSKPGAEGNWTCSHCDCDYCMQCGKEKIVGTKLWLTPA